VALYLGSHEPSWLWRHPGIPLFVSDRRLKRRRTAFPRAVTTWALDSGGFTELANGGWQTTAADYVARVRRYRDDVGGLDWCAPQDWMCEPGMRDRTGLTVAEHQRRTVDNFGELRAELGALVVPVLQGWEPDDYVAHVAMYDRAGVQLADEPLVGVGSICRRGADGAIGAVLAAIHGAGLHRLHGFGVRGGALVRWGGLLVSADSMAWSYAARREGLPGDRNQYGPARAWWHRQNRAAHLQPTLPLFGDGR